MRSACFPPAAIFNFVLTSSPARRHPGTSIFRGRPRRLRRVGRREPRPLDGSAIDGEDAGAGDAAGSGHRVPPSRLAPASTRKSPLNRPGPIGSEQLVWMRACSTPSTWIVISLDRAPPISSPPLDSPPPLSPSLSESPRSESPTPSLSESPLSETPLSESPLSETPLSESPLSESPRCRNRCPNCRRRYSSRKRHCRGRRRRRTRA